MGSVTDGSMDDAVRQAIGAQLARPDRQVVSVSGDGGFAMLMGDFLTVRQLNLPVKIVIFNNGSLAFVELEMIAAGLPYHRLRLNKPKFSFILEAAGIQRIPVKKPAAMSARPTAASLRKRAVLVAARVYRLG